jgi:hypothetical protein
MYIVKTYTQRHMDIRILNIEDLFRLRFNNFKQVLNVNNCVFFIV